MLPFNGPADEAKCEDVERVIVGNDPEKFFQIGVKLPLQEREHLVESLEKMLMCSHGACMKPWV